MGAAAFGTLQFTVALKSVSSVAMDSNRPLKLNRSNKSVGVCFYLNLCSKPQEQQIEVEQPEQPEEPVVQFRGCLKSRLVVRKLTSVSCEYVVHSTERAL